jgi:uncharacterized protein
MEARVSIVSLGVADMERSRQFYEQGLGWQASAIGDGDVAFYQAAAMIVGLYDRGKLAAEEDLPPLDDPLQVHGGITLAQNQASKADVDDVVEGAVRAGGTLRRKPTDTFWGGYAGSFADPDGHVWEIAWNPFFTLDESGIRLPD